MKVHRQRRAKGFGYLRRDMFSALFHVGTHTLPPPSTQQMNPKQSELFHLHYVRKTNLSRITKGTKRHNRVPFF